MRKKESANTIGLIGSISMKSRINKKYVKGAIIGVIVVAAGFLGFRQYEEEKYRPRDFDEFVREEKPTEAEIMEYTRRLEKAYENDIYGGDTPEETLNLFIEALKAEDIELASKYFIVEKQEEMRRELTISKENNVLPILVKDLEKEKKGGGDEQRYTFTTFDENNVAEFSFDLVKNPETGKWKLESL